MSKCWICMDTLKDYENLKDDISGQILVEKKTVEKYRQSKTFWQN